MLSRIVKFVEKDDVPYAIEHKGGRIFHMVHRNHERWVEIEDSDWRCRIRSYSSSISESDAMLLADEMAEDIREAAASR